MALLSCFYKNSLNIAVAHESKLGDIVNVLTEIFIEALLVDEEQRFNINHSGAGTARRL